MLVQVSYESTLKKSVTVIILTSLMMSHMMVKNLEKKCFLLTKVESVEIMRDVRNILVIFFFF